MNDRRRWLDDPGALSPEERRVLEAGLEVAPPKGMKAAVKGALLARLAPPEATTPETASSDAAVVTSGASKVTTVALGAFLKSVGIGMVCGVAAGVSWVSLPQGEPDSLPRNPPRSPPGSVVAPDPAAVPERTRRREDPAGTVAVTAPSPSGEALSTAGPERVATVSPSAAQGSATGDSVNEATPAHAPSVSAFPETLSKTESAKSESKLLAQARALLRNDDASAAFAALERLRHDYPRGLLIQEREVLAIEALQAMGQEEAAKSRAKVFLAHHPNSPHAASARRVLDR